MRIDIKVAGNLADWVRTSRSRFLETRSLLEAIAKRLRYTFQLNITESRTPEGQAFRALKPPIRKKVTNDPRPLIDSFNLVSSFTYQFVGDKSIVVGDPTRYGIYHNLGTKHVPRRSFIGIRPDDEEQMHALVSGWAGWVFGIYDAPEANVFTDTARIY